MKKLIILVLLIFSFSCKSPIERILNGSENIVEKNTKDTIREIVCGANTADIIAREFSIEDSIRMKIYKDDSIKFRKYEKVDSEVDSYPYWIWLF